MIATTPLISPRSKDKRMIITIGIKNIKIINGHSGRANFLKLSLMLESNFLTSNEIPFSSRLLGNALIGYKPGQNLKSGLSLRKLVRFCLLVFVGKNMEYHNEIWLSQVERWLKLSPLETPLRQCFGNDRREGSFSCDNTHHCNS